MKNQAHTITRKITSKLYVVEYRPADSDVYTSFLVFNEGSGWRITNEGNFDLWASSKNSAVSFIQTITRSQLPHLFQN
jgi:hypothetical protein